MAQIVLTPDFSQIELSFPIRGWKGLGVHPNLLRQKITLCLYNYDPNCLDSRYFTDRIIFFNQGLEGLEVHMNLLYMIMTQIVCLDSKSFTNMIIFSNQGQLNSL